MGRRCRHLNPVHAGAVVRVDARLINAAHNSSVASWGASGTNMTAPGSQQPTFQTNIVGGQPAVLFDGAATNAGGDYMVATVSITSNSTTAVWLERKTSYAGPPSSTYTRLVANFNSANGPAENDTTSANSWIPAFISAIDLGAGTNRMTGYRASTLLGSLPYTENTWALGGATLSGSTATIRNNKAQASATTTASAMNSNRFTLGGNWHHLTTTAGGDGGLNGHVAAAAMFPVALGASMIARIEQSYALSFCVPYG